MAAEEGNRLVPRACADRSVTQAQYQVSVCKYPDLYMYLHRLVDAANGGYVCICGDRVRYKYAPLLLGE